MQYNGNSPITRHATKADRGLRASPCLPDRSTASRQWTRRGRRLGATCCSRTLPLGQPTMSEPCQHHPTHRVEGAPVVPDRDVSDARRVVDRPLEPDLQVVIVRHECLPSASAPHAIRRITHEEVVQKQVRLVLGHAQDALCELLVNEQPFPARDGVDADDRVHRLKVLADVERVASHLIADLVAVRLRGGLEPLGLVVRRQPLKRLGDGRAEARVRLVCRRPERVAACRGRGVHFEDGVVGRDGLESDVRVPALRGELGQVAPVEQRAAFARDHGDLVAFRRAAFGCGVDVQPGLFWVARELRSVRHRLWQRRRAHLAELASEHLLILEADVLSPEEDNAALAHCG